MLQLKAAAAEDERLKSEAWGPLGTDLRSWLLPYLRCPETQSPLRCVSFDDETSDDTTTGVLFSEEGARLWYPIVRGVPRMLPESLRPELTGELVSAHRERLEELGLVRRRSASSNDELYELKAHTIQNFGFEWLEYARWGWDEEEFDITVDYR